MVVIGSGRFMVAKSGPSVSRGGLLLLRRNPPLTRRAVAYLMGWSAAFTQAAAEV